MNRSTSMYQDMASRTGSSIYIGVVGPVRTGKSTFIKRFMEKEKPTWEVFPLFGT